MIEERPEFTCVEEGFIYLTTVPLVCNTIPGRIPLVPPPPPSPLCMGWRVTLGKILWGLRPPILFYPGVGGQST